MPALRLFSFCKKLYIIRCKSHLTDILRNTDMSKQSAISEDPRKRILKAAKRLFACKCYEGTGMRNIAREAEVNLAMINYYFGSKHKILETLIDE